MEDDDHTIWIVSDPLERFLALGLRHVFFNDGARQCGDIVLNDLRLSIGHDRGMGGRIIDDE